MHLPPTLLLASTLYLLSAPLALACAQEPNTTAADATAGAADEHRYAVDGLQVRRWRDANGTHAAASRDGGRTWDLLRQPDDRLHFVLAQFDPTNGEPQLGGALAAPAGTRLHLVQFHTQVLAEYRRAVEAAGIEILHYLPENALFVRGDAAALAALRGLPCVRWVGALQNGFKLDAALRAFVVGPADARLGVNLVLARKADRARLLQQVTDLGGRVVDACDGSVMVMAELTAAQLRTLLAADTVTWADPTTEVGFDMDNARIQGGGNYVETQGGYTGRGVRAEITEAFNELHVDFTNAPGRVLVRGTNSSGSHGHCTAGIVGGNGTNNAAARGMMSECTLIEGSYGASSHYNQIVGSTNPSLAWKSMLATASWGSAVTTAYTSISVTVDDALFDSDLTRLNSQSNQNSQRSRPEAWAKNIISGGGVSHGNDSNPANDVWTSASYGPASDGRQKPDVCAYYDNVMTSDVGGGYTSSFSGTSSATTIIAGHLGLMLQMFTDGLFGNPLPLPATEANRFANKPHMSTSKAMLLNTARPYPTAQVERRKQGWGFPDLARIYDHREKIVLVDEYEALQQGQTRSYLVWIAPGTPEFRATMVYTDPAGVANSLIHRVNDADLTIRRLADGVVFRGTNGPAAANITPPGGAANTIDNVEIVYLGNPPAGFYEVAVRAASVAQDGKVETPQLDLDFALAMHPVGGGFHDHSGLTFDLASTGPGNLSATCANVPVGGWTEGFTLLSFDATHPRGFGDFFGIEADFLTAAIWTVAPAAGSVFHFTNSAGQYPFAPFTFDAGLVNALAGLPLDGVVMLTNGPNVVAQSNVDRITIE
jgi:serine protease AprX